MNNQSCPNCGVPLGIRRHDDPDLLFKSQDHPEANKRVAKVGDTEYILRFTLEDGRILALKIGESGFQSHTQLLFDMLSNAPSHDDGSLDKKP